MLINIFLSREIEDISREW